MLEVLNGSRAALVQPMTLIHKYANKNVMYKVQFWEGYFGNVI